MGEEEEPIPEGWNYDVFLSFRGADTRRGFLAHLVKELRRCGIYTFLDDVELRRGAEIRSNLLEAIERSRILVVVLSTNYASSVWCLEELLHIMRCHRRNSRQLVFPIFYKIEPSDIRRQIGIVAQSFFRHEGRSPLNEVQSWRLALTEVANLSGWALGQDGCEAEALEDITREFLNRLNSLHLHVASYPVGIRSRVQQIHHLLSFDSDDVQVIGICGMVGIGKTTIAKAVYNEVLHRFEGTSFLANVREYSEKHEGRTHLQRQLLSDILKRHDIMVNSIDHALKERFRRKRVLVVIDDVEDLSQLTSLGFDMSWFGPGSRIIITTRNKHLLKQLGSNNIYLPEELDGGESLELFSWHAFRTKEPPEEFLGLSENVVEYCGGLPLAVEFLGGFLFKRSFPEWKKKLELLRRTPHDNIQKKLEISFNDLSIDQKDIFLDVACFFIGMDKGYVTYILDGCGLCPDIGLSVLSERCLIEVHDNKLMMHALIRDMGRHIVQKESPNICGKRSRLWDPADVIDVLTKYSGTEEVKGLSLKAQIPDVESLDAKAFSNLGELRLLQLSHVQLRGSYKNLPKGLRWLCWHGFPLKIIPADFDLQALVVMDMQYSNLERLWNAWEAQLLKQLKYLDLSHSVYLRETPNFSDLPNLEKLLLGECKSLTSVHKSIGTLLEKLLLLNLSGCIELEDLPAELYKLKSLETLILSGCLKLKKLDDGFGEMQALTTFLADHTAIEEVPSSIIHLKKLKSLALGGRKVSCNDCSHSGISPHATSLIPVSLSSLSWLRTLRLSYCSLSEIPEDLGSMSSLEELDLRGNNFHRLQTDFAGLLKLRVLRLDNCSNLQSMYSLPRRLKSLHATDCISLERTPDLSECLLLEAVYLSNCINLVETPGLDKLETVRVIRMEMCNRISDSFRDGVLQAWAVRGYGGIFLPGSRLPYWFSFKDEKQSVSFTVPETLNLDPIGFNLCTRYTSQLDNVMSGYSPRIKVKNHTRGSVWIRKPATYNIRLYFEQHLWQGHISSEDIPLKPGDQLEVDIDFGDQVTVLQTGVALVYKSEESYAEFLRRPVIGHTPALNEPDAASIDEDSIDEIIDEQLNQTLDEAKSPERETMEDFYEVNECSDCTEIQRYQKIPRGTAGESHHRPPRKMSVGIRHFLGLFGLLAFIVSVRRYREPLQRFLRVPAKWVLKQLRRAIFRLFLVGRARIRCRRRAVTLMREFK